MPEGEVVRPTKKQKELLDFIAGFIAEHGYSPSYREIMNALNYTSVATVALHVGNLIKRGHLQKRDRSARSLEVVESAAAPVVVKSNEIKPGDEKWLIEKIEHFFANAEANGVNEQSKIDELYVLIGALKVLGLEGASQSFMPRLTNLKNRVQ
jgi:SOS-response transcriptional repressor LexA